MLSHIPCRIWDNFSKDTVLFNSEEICNDRADSISNEEFEKKATKTRTAHICTPESGTESSGESIRALPSSRGTFTETHGPRTAHRGTFDTYTATNR